MKAPETPVFLDYLLPDQVLIGGFQPQLGESFIKVIPIDGFPLESDAQMLKDLDGIGCEYRWCTRFICLSKNEAVKELKKYSTWVLNSHFYRGKSKCFFKVGFTWRLLIADMVI